MISVSSKEAQNHFGSLMATVVKEPISISKYGKPSAVLISQEEYERLDALEDLYWIMRAERAGSQGFLSKKESKNVVDKILKS